MTDHPRTVPNRLPGDGVLLDHGTVWSGTEADALFVELLHTLPWQADRVRLFGRDMLTARQVCWLGDAALSYRYSGYTRIAQPWTATVRAIKARVEALTGARFNSCLANLYPTGRQGMGWHSDDEPELGPEPVIASVSFGATRRFQLRHRALRHPDVELLLRSGSLIVMQGAVQRAWRHQVPKMARIQTPRVNLTFRLLHTLACA